MTDSLLQLIQLSLLDACGRAASLSASELLLGASRRMCASICAIRP